MHEFFPPGLDQSPQFTAVAEELSPSGDATLAQLHSENIFLTTIKEYSANGLNPIV